MKPETSPMLTDEEMNEALKPYWIRSSVCDACHHLRPGFYALSETERDKVIAHAQLKKILEWIRAHKTQTSHNIFPPKDGYVISLEELEELSKEVGE